MLPCGPVVMVTGENNAQNDDFKLNFRKMVREGKKKGKKMQRKKSLIF